MEQLPNWLTDAVAAAGMTAYADELYPKVSKDMGIDSPSILDLPPLHCSVLGYSGATTLQ